MVNEFGICTKKHKSTSICMGKTLNLAIKTPLNMFSEDEDRWNKITMKTWETTVLVVKYGTVLILRTDRISENKENKHSMSYMKFKKNLPNTFSTLKWI